MSPELLYAIGAVMDITERKQAEEALRESEERYRSLLNDALDSMKVGVFILDAKFQIVWLNQAIERSFGLRREDVIGRDKRQLIREQIRGIFEDPETFSDKVLATYDNNTYIENFECHVLPEGEREDRWLEHWSHPIRSGLYAGGRIEHYYDITERRRAEEAKEHLAEQLHQSQKMEAVGRLAAGVAHDFNNLLTVILGNVEMLLGEFRNGSGENKRLLEQVQFSAERGAELVDELLAFGRRRPAGSTVFDLKELMERMDELMRRLLREDIHLRLHLPEEQALIKADPAQIEQVIMNLVLNARDALPHSGGISLSCEHGAPDRTTPLPHPVAPETRFVVMTVSDTGTGMDTDTLDRIFEPFFTTKTVGEGTGLGLATVYGIVTGCDAQITVESTLGQGSTFRVYFPAAEPPASGA